MTELSNVVAHFVYRSGRLRNGGNVSRQAKLKILVGAPGTNAGHGSTHPKAPAPRVCVSGIACNEGAPALFRGELKDSTAST